MSRDDQIDDAGDAIDAEALEALPAAEPPPDFAERVLAARGRSVVEPPEQAAAGRSIWGARIGWRAVLVAAVAVGFVLLIMGRARPLPTSEGLVSAGERQEVRIGHRGVAVVEPGGAIRWTVSSDGAAAIEHRQGDVFYRVERGGPFAVETARARVVATGTSFRVEVTEMKVPKSGLLGAALGAAVAVTVYEGSVLLADKETGETSEVTAGQKVVVGGGGGSADRAPSDAPADDPELAALLAPPPDDATAEQLRARDAALRARLAEAGEKLALARRDVAAARVARRDAEEDDGRPWFDPSPDTLQAFAKECRVRYDTPPIMGVEPTKLPPEMAGELGLSDAELAALNEVMARLHRDWIERMRGLYVEVTGDVDGAGSLSAKAMAEEIRDKSPRRAETAAQKKIARERAGLEEPPADWSKAPPVERYYRELAGLGDEMERRLAELVGPERARQMRADGGGWGMQMEVGGCPSDDAKSIDLEE